LIGEGGVEALTPSTVADRAGIPVSAIYQYFENTDAIVKRYLSSELDKIGAASAAALGQMEWVTLRGIFEAAASVYTDYYRSHGDTVQIWMLGRRNEAVTEAIATQIEGIAAWMDEIIRRAGFVKEESPGFGAELLVLSFDRMFEFVFAKQRSRPEQDEIIDRFVDMICTYIDANFATELGVKGLAVEEFFAAASGMTHE
jgi:AcrR family transcriptional regulator